MFGLSYWFLPAFAGCVWLGTLLGLLCGWAANGKHLYPWNNDTQYNPYISDIAATGWGKPLFITGSAVMVVIFDLSFIAERWLRHKSRLAQNYKTSEKILSGFAIAFAIIGGLGLIFLTIFDTRRHPSVHVAMLVVFIAGYIISAVFICAEYQRLGVLYREHRILRISFWIKLAFIFIELALAIGFGVLARQDRYNTAAILEWLIALIYIFYVWSFTIDFLPAIRTRNKSDRFGPPLRAQDDEMAMRTEMGGNNLGGPVYTSGGVRYDDAASYGSAAPMAEPGYRQPPGVVTPSRNF